MISLKKDVIVAISQVNHALSYEKVKTYDNDEWLVWNTDTMIYIFDVAKYFLLQWRPNVVTHSHGVYLICYAYQWGHL